jgi:uncharacterized protein YjiS (DUF1127 family)
MTRSSSFTAPNGNLRSPILAMGQWLGRWNTRRKARHTARLLHRLADFQLHDIGLRRDQIDRELLS